MRNCQKYIIYDETKRYGRTIVSVYEWQSYGARLYANCAANLVFWHIHIYYSSGSLRSALSSNSWSSMDGWAAIISVYNPPHPEKQNNAYGHIRENHNLEYNISPHKRDHNNRPVGFFRTLDIKAWVFLFVPTENGTSVTFLASMPKCATFTITCATSWLCWPSKPVIRLCKDSIALSAAACKYPVGSSTYRWIKERKAHWIHVYSDEI